MLVGPVQQPGACGHEQVQEDFLERFVGVNFDDFFDLALGLAFFVFVGAHEGCESGAWFGEGGAFGAFEEVLDFFEDDAVLAERDEDLVFFVEADPALVGGHEAGEPDPEVDHEFVERDLFDDLGEARVR